ncbi:MAG: hypothetical protein CBE00_03770 [Planctomycetaceae bacterium TMED240]|nr:hypothetical protein [Rhodopirellula sp.]OUX07777.1 MAG: hypothetical protein CBE00_03770 [Planctomycetaceae bacterium TMED240]
MLSRICLWSTIILLPLYLEAPSAIVCGNNELHTGQADNLATKLSHLTAVPNPNQEQLWEIAQVAKQLRDLGPTGLAATLRAFEPDSQGSADILQQRLFEKQIDFIAGQKQASACQLYWYKSLAVAKSKSIEFKRPIISLRLLGHLDEDLSCANSRFFRRILYTDPYIAKLLQQHFILHWQSVRDVPIVTIDFGDGRKLRQPMLGNSVHLAVTGEGRVIDALPGLVTPTDFGRWAKSIIELHKTCLSLPATDFQQHLQLWHQNRAKQRREQSELTIRFDQEVSDLNPIDPRWKTAAEQIKPTTTHPTANQIKKNSPSATAAMRTAPLKMAAELHLFRMVESLAPQTEVDSFFNLYGLQPKLDDWYARNLATGDYDKLTNRIYEELFLMPLNDPWLGLSLGDRSIALDIKEQRRIETPDLPALRLPEALAQ